MKFNDLYDFIMESIPEEEWEAFYNIEPVANVNYIGYDQTLLNEMKKPYVFARQREVASKDIYWFNVDVHGEAWRKEFFLTFFTKFNLCEIEISRPDEQFRKEMICYLISEYLFSACYSNNEFYRGKRDTFISIRQQMPEGYGSYLGNRRNTAICAEYWVYSEYDVDENMPEIVAKDNRFKGKIEKQIALDLTLSIRDFFKYFPFVGIERKAA